MLTKSKSGIYQIKNLINGKLYIGSSANLITRKSNHFLYLKKNKHYNKHLQHAYNKYGMDNFIYEILEYIEWVEDKKILKINLLEREQYWIDKFKTNNNKYGYNLRLKAESNLGMVFSEEAKENMSNARLGSKNPRYGKHCSEETKEKISKSNKGNLIGENNPTTKLFNNDILKIREMIFNNKTDNDIAQIFNVNTQIIYRIRQNESWKHISLDYISNEELKQIKQKKHTSKKLKSEDVKIIKKMIFNKVNQHEIAEYFNISHATVSSIKQNKTWKNVQIEEISNEDLKNIDYRCKLTSDELKRIKILLKKEIPQSKIAEIFKVSQALISHINLGKYKYDEFNGEIK